MSTTTGKVISTTKNVAFGLGEDLEEESALAQSSRARDVEWEAIPKNPEGAPSYNWSRGGFEMGDYESYTDAPFTREQYESGNVLGHHFDPQHESPLEVNDYLESHKLIPHSVQEWEDIELADMPTSSTTRLTPEQQLEISEAHYNLPRPNQGYSEAAIQAMRLGGAIDNATGGTRSDPVAGFGKGAKILGIGGLTGIVTGKQIGRAHV